MELTVFLKMLLDASAFLTVGGYIVSIFTPVSLLSLSAIFIALAAGGAYLTRQRHGLARWSPIVLALPAFLFANTYGDIGLITALFGYLIYVTAKGIFFNDDNDFKDLFQKTMFISVCFCLFAALAVQLDKLNSIMLPYVFIMIVCGIALMRILRHSREIIDSRAFKLSNILTVGLVCILTLALSSDAFLGTVGSILSFIYNKVIINFLMVFIYGMARFLSLFSRLFAMIFNREVKFYEDGDSAGMGNTDDLIFDEEIVGDVPDIIVWIFCALCIAGAIFLVVKGLKALAGKNRRFDKKSDFEMNRQIIEITKPPRRNPFARRTEREAVRHEYRKFLKECLTRGFKITPDYDTHQISTGAGEFFPQAPLEPLRSIYIKARYTDMDISKQEAKKAKELYSAIKNTSLMPKEEEK